MAKRKHDPGTLIRFVTRAISDKSKTVLGHRFGPRIPHALAIAAIRAVKRGKDRGCR